MPEIWLNYGKNEVVLDIMAENLDERIEFEKTASQRLRFTTKSKRLIISFLSFPE